MNDLWRYSGIKQRILGMRQSREKKHWYLVIFTDDGVGDEDKDEIFWVFFYLMNLTSLKFLASPIES